MIKLHSCRHALHDTPVGAKLTHSTSRKQAQYPCNINFLTAQACDAMAGISSQYRTCRLQQAPTVY